MCYPKPGPRCSAHAAKVLAKAKTAYRDDRSGKYDTIELKERLKQAQVQYDMTPAGLLELERRVGVRNPHDKDLERLELARVRRAEALKSIGINSEQGDMNTHKDGIKNPSIEAFREHQDASVMRMGWSRRDTDQEGRARGARVRKALDIASSKWMQRITPAQMESISWITSNGSMVVNGHLAGNPVNIWGEDAYTPATIEDAIANTDSAMDAAPRLKEPVIAYRGIKPDIADAYRSVQPGEAISFPMHASASLDPTTASGFTSDGSVVIEAKTRKIASTTAVSAWGSSESEILLDRRTQWKVVNVLQNVHFGNNAPHRKGYTVIQVEEA